MDNEQAFEEVENQNQNLVLRIVLGVAAVIIIGVAAFPFINTQFGSNQSQPAGDAQTGSTSAQEQFELGNGHYEAGRWDQAVAAYQKAIKLDPNYQAAYANLGVTYYQQQKFNLAALQYEKALELNPQDGEVAYNLGVLYLQQALAQGSSDQELLNQAVTQLETAREMSPNLAEPYFSLGVAYLALNQKADAIQAFETFLSLDSGQDPQARQEAENYLQTLR